VTRCDPDQDRAVVEAVCAVRAGNVEAYTTIIERFQGPILTVSTAIMRDRQAAEELAQDVFVRAFERLDTFDARRPMKPWLTKIAYRLAQEGWRAQARERVRRQTVAATLRHERRDKGPLDSLLADEQSRMLWQAVAGLPMGERTAVVLYYREGLTVNEVAEAMGVSMGTVKTHLFRARSHIHADLQSHGFEKGGES
jgi:RNA polymerase sigma-70 factor (ECF subfamily)